MKSDIATIAITLFSVPLVHAAAVRDFSGSGSGSSSNAINENIARVAISSIEDRHASSLHIFGSEASSEELWKRRGGGGGGARGGGGSSSGGSSSSSSSSSRGGSSSSSSSSSTKSGSGTPRTYGGGSYYSGGSVTPYRSGATTAAGLTAVLFTVALLSFWPGSWYGPAYLYHYPNSYRYGFHNQTSNKNESLAVLCACSEDEMCGCDQNNSTDYFDSLIGNGSYSALNQSVVSVATVNGTKTLLLNGTLSNDTTSPDSDSMASFTAPIGLTGYWPVVLASLAAAYVL